jgi:16S rRNA (uracil1498-N3)-methyltransferase
MRLIRFYTPTLQQDSTALVLTESHHHQICHVLRLKTGYVLEIFNGEGLIASGTIREITKREVMLDISQIQTLIKPKQEIHIALALIKSDPLDLALQKLVELGASHIYLLETEFSDHKKSTDFWAKKSQHWDNILIHACQQSRQNFKPKLLLPQSFRHFITNAPQSILWIAHPESKQGLLKALQNISPSTQAICLCLGPEGGFSETEIAFALEHQFTPVHLGPLILRAETAALLGAGLVSQYFISQ